MDLVTDLFPLVAEDAVGLARFGHFHHVVEEPVQLDARVAGAGKATPSEDAGPQPEVPSVLLCHHIRRNLTGAEYTVQAAVDRKRLLDSVVISAFRVVI